MANGRFLLWVRNTLKLNTVPGYSADYDKTRGDSVFVDNANNTMEVNNLQEGLTPTQYHGQKASVLDGTTQYWSEALPTNVLTGTQNDFVSAGTLPSGFSASGATWNQTGILGSTSTNVLKLTGTNAYAMFTGLTVGKKYKLKVRWFGDNTLRIGSTSTGSDYATISATTQWNRVERTFTATAASISLSIASGTVYIDILNFTEDWKLDLNESYELIKHSMNRDFEQTLGTELWTNTTFADSNADGLANGLEHYNVKTTEVDTIETDADGKHQKIVGSVDTRMIIKPSNLSQSSMYNVTITYKSTGTIEFITGYINGGQYTKYILPASDTKRTVSFDNYLDGRISSGIWFDMSNRTFQIYSISIREIPSLVTNGLFSTDSAGWFLGSWSRNAGGYVEINTTSIQNFFQSYNFVVGRRYRVTFEIKNYVSGTVGYKANNVAPTTFFNSNGVKCFDWTQTTSYNYITFETGATFNGAIDNIHVYEISDYAPSVNAQVSGNNHYCQISSIDKQGTTGTQSLRITAGGAGRGAEVLTNGDVTGSATGWTLASGAVYGTSNIVCTNYNISSLENNAVLTVGKTYEVIYTITRTAGSIKVRLGTGNTGTARTESGTYREVQICATTTKLFLDGTNFYGTIEGVSVKELLGEVSLPAAQIDTIVAGNKYTKEFWARLDPASLSYGSDLASGWDFTSGWATVSGTVVDSNSFSTAGEGGIRKDFGSNGAKIYKCRIAGTTTASTMRIMDYGISTTYYGSSVTGVSGTFDVTFYFSASSKGLHFRNNGAGQTDITAFELYEATPITITGQLGTKSVTSGALSIVPGTFTKVVLNFEATASEVGQDIKLYLNGAGSVYVDNLSLTQAYDRAFAFGMKSNVDDSSRSLIYMNSYDYVEIKAGGYFRNNVSDGVNQVNDSLSTYAKDTWINFIALLNRTDKLYGYKNGVADAGVISTSIGKFVSTSRLSIGVNTGNTEHFKGLIAPLQILRFTNISQSNFNPNTYKPGDAITGGGVEIVLWQDWSTVSGGTAYDKYRPETTVRNDLTAYGTPHAGNNIVTIKDYSPQTEKLRQGTQSKQPIFSSTEGFDFDGTDDILEAGASLGSIKTVILKLKADNLELAQDILQLSAAAKLTLNTDGTITATGWTSPTVKIQNTLLADSAITANSEYLIAVKTNTAIDATAFKLGGSTSFFNGKIKKVVTFTTTLDDPTIQKIFKSIRSM